MTNRTSVEMSNRGRAAEVPLQGNRRQQEPMNMNHYANKKSAAESMLDVALLMANASQLKTVIERGASGGFTIYVVLITLISISLLLQVLVGGMLIFIVKWNLNDERTHDKLNILENLAMVMVMIIVLINIVIPLLTMTPIRSHLENGTLLKMNK